MIKEIYRNRERYLSIRIITYFLIITCLSCKESKHAGNHKTEIKKVSDTVTIKAPKKIGFYIAEDKADSVWTAKQNASESFYPKIIFHKEFAQYQFHSQCFYWFFTNYYYTGTDKIELFWTYKKDFAYDIESLEKTNGIKNHPRYGDDFCEYRLVNDSVIKVKYNFPEWVKKVNEIEKDSIFPQYFYLEKPSSR